MLLADAQFRLRLLTDVPFETKAMNMQCLLFCLETVENLSCPDRMTANHRLDRTVPDNMLRWDLYNWLVSRRSRDQRGISILH